MSYNVIKITLDKQPKYITFNTRYVDIITKWTTADLSKVYVSVNGGTQVPLNDFVPIPIPVRQMVLNWESSEDGKVIAFLVVDHPITKVKQSITILTDESGIKANLDNIDTKFDVNLSTRASEATLSKIANALASIGTDKVLTTPDNPPNLDTALSDTKVAFPTSLKGADITISNTGTTPLTQALFATSTPSKRAIIVNTSSTVDVKIGDGTNMATLPAGKSIETYVKDLSVIQVEVPASSTATLTVYWEV